MNWICLTIDWRIRCNRRQKWLSTSKRFWSSICFSATWVFGCVNLFVIFFFVFVWVIENVCAERVRVVDEIIWRSEFELIQLKWFERSVSERRRTNRKKTLAINKTIGPFLQRQLLVEIAVTVNLSSESLGTSLRFDNLKLKTNLLIFRTLSYTEMIALTFRTSRRKILNSNFCSFPSRFESSSLNFHCKIVWSSVLSSTGCNRLYSFANTFFKLTLNWRWSERLQIRRFDWLALDRDRAGERRIFILLIFGHIGLPFVVVVFGIGLPWPSEHQQPAPPIHWTAAYVPSERQRGKNFFGDADRWAIAYARDLRHSVYE